MTAPTPLIVSSADIDVLALNRLAYDRLRGERGLEVVRGATHVFGVAGGFEIARALMAPLHEKEARAP